MGQEEDEVEREEVKEEEEEEKGEKEKKKEELVWTSPVETEAPVNYAKCARARRLARLEEQRQLDLMCGKCPMHPKSTERNRAVEENEDFIADCFCGECAPSGAFIANSDSS